MSEKEKNGGGVLDFKTVAVLFAVLGGAYLVQSPLQSSRPAEKETLERTAIGDQVIPARLWQDPFEVTMAYRRNNKEKIETESGAPPAAKGDRGEEPFHSFSELAHQVLRHLQLTKVGDTARPVIILEAMIAGGSYAEDAELRHRSRYAVLAALEVAGYVPWDEEHIGYAETPWPRGQELEGKPKNQLPTLDSIRTRRGSRLGIPFEWFIPNQPGTNRSAGDVLVLWLNDDAFDDHPAKRLAQFNHHLREQVGKQEEWFLTRRSEFVESLHTNLHFKLLDPRLHSMLNESLEPDAPPSDQVDKPILIKIPEQLAGLEIYSSWSTTADALLATNSESARRESLKCELCKRGWGTNFLNATCTDDELVEELIDELALRGTDVANGTDAVALIAEWDTFYGRALPFTFAAMVKFHMQDRVDLASIRTNPGPETLLTPGSNCVRLAMLRQLTNCSRPCLAAKLDGFVTDNRSLDYQQVKTTNQEINRLISYRTNLSKAKLAHLNRLLLEDAFPELIVPNRLADVVSALREDPRQWPTNIVRYSYLRGIDGQLPGESPAAPSETKVKEAKDKDTDKEKASDEPARPEGHSQLDYLPRLAERLEDWEKFYENARMGKVKAIGILGSDVYDKLLVLQSLRPHFADELFFTTDLDARLLHPQSLKWSRNVIVASSFGLRLRHDLQKELPPFRDTYQVGEYLACLAALGYGPAQTNLTNFASLWPRRFEIGRKGAYDLSIGESPLYPKAPWQKRTAFARSFRPVSWLLALGVLVLLLAYFLPRKPTTPEALSPSEILRPATLAAKLNPLTDSRPDALFIRLSRFLSADSLRLLKELKARASDAQIPMQEEELDPHLHEALAADLTRALREIDPEDFARMPGTETAQEGPSTEAGNLQSRPLTANSSHKREKPLNAHGPEDVRFLLNHSLLQKQYPEVIAERPTVRLWTMWACIFALLGLVIVAWVLFADHFRAGGEPFSWTQGLSSGPTQLIRCVAAGLATILFFLCRSELLEKKQELINEYRLPAITTTRARNQLWRQEMENQIIGPRLERILQCLEDRRLPRVKAFLKALLRWLGFLRWISIKNWNVTPAPPIGGGGPVVNGDKLFEKYNLLGYWWHRLYRLLWPMMGYLIFGGFIFAIFDFPSPPHRGNWSMWLDQLAMYGSLLLQTLLIFFVVDAARLCRKLIENLIQSPIDWPKLTWNCFEEKLGLERAYLGEYVMVQIIAARTAAVGELVFYPFLILLLTILSRSSFFNHFDWPVSLILLYSLSSALALYAVWQLRGAAEEARKFALAGLNGKLLRVLGTPSSVGYVAKNDSAIEHPSDQDAKRKNLSEQLRMLIKEIESCEEGAFAPVTNQPVIKALLMPLGGAGVITLLNYLSG